MDIGRHGGQSRSGADGRHPSLLWVAVVWFRVVFGLCLATVGGVAFGHAWTSESLPWWGVGGITLLVGLLLVLSGLYARSRPPGIIPQVIVTEETPEAQEPLVPLLGALLVYKYQLITHKQLREALEEQRKTVPRRRLGEILVLRGLITLHELEESLAFQQPQVPEEEAIQAADTSSVS